MAATQGVILADLHAATQGVILADLHAEGLHKAEAWHKAMNIQSVMRGAQGAFFNDTYLLNTATWRWHALPAVGSPPAARHAHVAATAAGRTLIHGGSNAAQSFDGVIAASTDFGRELSGCA